MSTCMYLLALFIMRQALFAIDPATAPGTGLQPASQLRNTSPMPSTLAQETRTLSNLAWFSVDSNGRIVDYEFAKPGDGPTCGVPTSQQVTEPSSAIPEAGTVGRIESSASNGATELRMDVTEITRVKWWKVDANGFITEYAVYSPTSPPTPQCYAVVRFAEDENGNWVMVDADCLNPCDPACYFCMHEEGDVTRWWCACATIGCGDVPN